MVDAQGGGTVISPEACFGSGLPTFVAAATCAAELGAAGWEAPRHRMHKGDGEKPLPQRHEFERALENLARNIHRQQGVHPRGQGSPQQVGLLDLGHEHETRPARFSRQTAQGGYLRLHLHPCGMAEDDDICPGDAGAAAERVAHCPAHRDDVEQRPAQKFC